MAAGEEGPRSMNADVGALPLDWPLYGYNRLVSEAAKLVGVDPLAHGVMLRGSDSPLDFAAHHNRVMSQLYRRAGLRAPRALSGPKASDPLWVRPPLDEALVQVAILLAAVLPSPSRRGPRL